MKRFAMLFALFPGAAFAHPGDHALNSFLANTVHFLTQPDHLTMLGGAVIVIALIAYLRSGASS